MKKIKINESQFNLLINEAAMNGFSVQELANMKSFNNRVNYCKKMLGNYIGNGSSRIVFQIDDEKVLKLAKNNKGIAQNEAEADWGAQGYDVLPKLYEVDDEYKYIISEFVLPSKPQDFKQCLGIDFNEFCQFVTFQYNAYARRPYRCNMNKERFNELYEKVEWLQWFVSYMGDYQLPLGDLIRIQNYGLTYRFNQPMIVLLDSGLTEEVFNDYYRR